MSSSLSTSTELPFHFRIAAAFEHAFEVVSFRGRESLSKPFVFDVQTVVGAEVDLDEAQLLGEPAVLFIPVPNGAMRAVRGIVESVSPMVPGQTHGRTACRFRIVPRLSRLRHCVTHRIFQDRTVPEIVAAVLEMGKVPVRFNLRRTYARRAYCVQYQESDLEFVTRLLAEEGIFYFFDHPTAIPSTEAFADREIMIFGDTAEAYPPIQDGAPGGLAMTGAFSLSRISAGPSPRLRLREHEGFSPAEDEVSRFSLRHAMKPNAVHLRDYDFRRPRLDLSSEAKAQDADTTLKIDDFRGEHDEPEVSPDRAQSQLEQYRRKAIVAKGSSSCRRLSPGYRFRLSAESSPKVAGEYAIVRVEHEGRAAAWAGGQNKLPSYEARFECAPSTVSYRPARPRKNLQQVMESATVVGPPNDEIYVDGHGRIKVQFHWDRDGKYNEFSSCWMRVVQSWAGASWGSQFIPRIGMEVMVSFVGGDVDCPVVLGAVYNAAHPSMHVLPLDATKSGIRTKSSPNGTGFNELTFEDRTGREQIYVHAERDFIEDIQHDQATTIGNDLRLSVRKQMDTRVGGHRTVSIAGRDEAKIEGDSRTFIGGTETQNVRGNWVKRIEGNSSVTIERDRIDQIGGNASLVVGEGGNENHYSLFVYGDHIAGARGMIKLEAHEGIRIACGDSVIEMTPEGVTIRAKKLSFSGAESASMEGNGPSLHLGEVAEISAKKLRLLSEDAWLVLDENASLKGRKVLLNCDDQKLDKDTSSDSSETRPLRIKLSDSDYAAYADKRYHLIVDGKIIEGKTDDKGLLDEKIAKDAKSIRIVLWVGEYPTGEKRTWEIKRVAMPEANTLSGAAMRLANLGYLGADANDNPELVRIAIKSFQHDAGLVSTGKLDKETTDKLVAVHGS